MPPKSREPKRWQTALMVVYPFWIANLAYLWAREGGTWSAIIFFFWVFNFIFDWPHFWKRRDAWKRYRKQVNRTAR